MAAKEDQDLFKDSTMTFGEHLDELRVALFKAVIGLVIGGAIGLFVGDYMVKAILRPLEGALASYYSDGALDKYAVWSADREANGLPVPYTQNEMKRLVLYDGLLFAITYIDPRQARDEVLRAYPDFAGEGSAPTAAGQGSAAGQVGEEVFDTTKEQAAQRKAADEKAESEKSVADSHQIATGLVPLFTFHPASDDDRIHAKSFSFPEMFAIWLKASLVVGTIISSPWVFYQIWSFVAAGLYPHEKRYVHVFLPFSLGLFLLGAATAYIFVFEPVLGFLLKFNSRLGVDPDPRISEWLGFVLLLPLGFGISFQLPLVMLFLDRIGIFNIRAYLDKWRVAVLVIFIISAILTPADPYSILFMAIPLTFLYFGGILLCYFLPAKRGE